MANNPFNGGGDYKVAMQASGIPADWITPTPHDSTANILNADGEEVVGICIGTGATGGDVSVVTTSGATRTFTLPAYAIWPVSVTQLLSTGTTATGVMIGLASGSA